MICLAICVDDLFGDIKTGAKPADFVGGYSSFKLLEDAAEVLFGDADAEIFNHDASARGSFVDADSNRLNSTGSWLIPNLPEFKRRLKGIDRAPALPASARARRA